MNHTRHACFPHVHFLKYTQEHDIHNTTHTFHMHTFHTYSTNKILHTIHITHTHVCVVVAFSCSSLWLWPWLPASALPQFPWAMPFVLSQIRNWFSPPTSHVRATGRSLLPVARMISALGQVLCSHHHAPPDCLWPVCLQEKLQLCCVCGHVCVCTCAVHRLTSDVIRQVPSTLYFETGFWFSLQCTSSARLGGK